ncbi:MAG TPA: SAM-dependent methyltransferase [Burkholderiales bacterium]|nr:SAM-dependent methyltransferase [Burkholderiales bacterium]
MLPPSLAHLPSPPPEAQALSSRLRDAIRDEIDARGGWISFARFMELALYAPALGYYSAGSTKLGAAGDFVTAPELSPLFAQCLARQIAQLRDADLPDVIELGAGSGALAADLLNALAALDRAPERYLILEVSAELRERQRTRIAARAAGLVERVQWLDVLPAKLEATLVANEVLDAVPTHVVRTRAGAVDEVGVTVTDGAFERALRPATGELLDHALALGLPGHDYQTEINLAAPALVKSLARVIARGALIFVDYGFPAREYYHSQRSRGTLMCHYRQHAHDDPFALVGLQDITAHVDFTAIGSAALDAGLRVLGYATQAQFLVNCGLLDIVGRTAPDDVNAYAPLASAAHKLTSPAEMGELFKVLALGKALTGPLIGFARGDRAHTL